MGMDSNIKALEQNATNAAIAWAKSEEKHLHDALIQIATDGVERRSFRRHRR